ncbi:hypothetical protein EAI89_21015 [Eubacterium sp. am_0171]|uniref:McrB family protein n=1 Tax=unclassified Eubacterium (in: firmicutes) TaxID=2624479 RepID=UPI00102108FB|nr:MULTISPECIES: AAA family ATPase [unclassified Eubacterium (in: firmicutes)]MSC86288.1 AAA domain-containing protein [Eubacterium sp. BIOML-A1]MSD07249.1 AAA domain-containing protein [Eubacterium sp. BIOML-A2]RYT11778.1 hypothetical protein EAI89_21015 [Eubacterium sp. am_0171]
MESNQAISIVVNQINALGTSISDSDYDGVIVKKLEASNTLDEGRSTNQTHIAITGSQMDIFPYLRSDGYFENDEASLKKFFVIQIPLRLYESNVSYLSDGNIPSEMRFVNGCLDSKTSVVRNKRRNQADQIQVSLINMDGKDFVEFRKLLITGTYFVLLKRKQEFKYDVFGIKEKDVPDEIMKLNNQFYNLSTSTAVELNDLQHDYEAEPAGNKLTPEWFNEKGKAYLYLDEESERVRNDFLRKYSPAQLKELEGISLLRTIFLNDENKDNLCYQLEFDSQNRELFGSIKSGTAYKYGLHFSKKNGQWATGTGRNPQFLSVDEAIELGTQIRDYLVDGAEIIQAAGELDSLDDYRELYKKLNEATDGYINRVWFLKYYQMIAPKVFPPIYSWNAQTTLLKALGEVPDDNAVVRMGQMQLFIRQCDVSSVVFSRTFWANYDNSNYDEEEPEVVSEIRFLTGLQSKYSRNRVVFGAPGTGKSFTLNEERKDLVGADNESNYERVTFHPDYSYANFVGTYKPVPCIDSEGRDSITYEYVPGPFMRVYVKALKNSRTDSIKPFLLLIEEINRANVAAVFGDIFQLLDRDEDGVSEYPIQATEDIKKYLASELGGYPSDYEKIRIPDNLFIWASMNSADQGVFPMDTAFKRRWDFTYLGIDDSDELIRGKTVVLGTKVKQKVEWNKLRKAINKFLADKGINEDKQLGPYFIARKIVVPASGDEIDREKFINTFKNKVIMYLFEDAAKQKRPSLFEGCFEGNSRYSEICREFEEKGIGIFNHEIQLNAEPEDLTGPETSENE